MVGFRLPFIHLHFWACHGFDRGAKVSISLGRSRHRPKLKNKRKQTDVSSSLVATPKYFEILLVEVEVQKQA